MTHQTALPQPQLDAARRLDELLERHSAAFPQLADELEQQRALARALAASQQHAAQALGTWRAALAQRWGCEVDAQRVYGAVQRQVVAQYGPDSAHSLLLAPGRPDSAVTPDELLRATRRLEAALGLSASQAPFAEAAAAQLRAAGDALAAAIDETGRCENERRRVLTDQRIAATLFEQAYERARRLLIELVDEPGLALPPLAPDAEASQGETGKPGDACRRR